MLITDLIAYPRIDSYLPSSQPRPSPPRPPSFRYILSVHYILPALHLLFTSTGSQSFRTLASLLNTNQITMTAEMDWSPDFCLACDRQSSGGAYCSQACRLADIERAGSEPVSPMSSAPPASWASSCLGTGSGFCLPPAVNFAAYKSSNMATSPASCRTSSTSSAQPWYLSNPVPRSQASSTSNFQAPSTRALTPSSSRSSLSSTRSSPTQEGQLSDQARNELRGYASSFDQVRDWKRRMTTT